MTDAKTHYLDTAKSLSNAVSKGSNATILAQRMNISSSQIRHYVRLDNNLSTATKALCRKTSILSMGHARVLATLQGERQLSVAREVVARRWSVRYLERYVRSPSPPQDLAYYDKLSETLSEQLGHPMTVRPDSNVPQNGVITLRYFGYEDFDAICSKMGIATDAY